MDASQAIAACRDVGAAANAAARAGARCKSPAQDAAFMTLFRRMSAPNLPPPPTLAMLGAWRSAYQDADRKAANAEMLARGNFIR